MSRVMHFELSARDPERAVSFYGELFGWQFQKWEGSEEYWLVTTGPDEEPGINGGMMRAQEEWPPGVVNIVAVDAIDACLERVTRHGGEVVIPRSPVSGMGYVAYCRDPGGAVFGLFEADAAAGG